MLSQMFEYEFVRFAFFATIAISLSCGILSPIVVLKERSYLSDTISHLIFPGVITGYILSKLFMWPLGYCLLSGAVVTAFLGTFISEFIFKTLKIPPDSCAIMSLAGFFSMGVILLSHFKNVHISADSILFGDVLTVQKNELIILVVVAILNLLTILFLEKHWMAWISDGEFSFIAGYKTKMLDKLFPILLTTTILTGLFTVGSLMISAFIIFPAILSNPKKILSWKTLTISVFCAIIGFIASFQINWPVGPSIVLFGFCLIVLKSLIKKLSRRIHI